MERKIIENREYEMNQPAAPCTVHALNHKDDLRTEPIQIRCDKHEAILSENNQTQDIPAVLYGNESDQVYLFVHGKNGFKEEACDFAKIACPKGWQVLSIDLPGHGERAQEADHFLPWLIVPELEAVMRFIKQRWNRIGLRANSIGAYLSMLCFGEEPIVKSLLVSPILNMEQLILDMMKWASVSEDDLRKRRSIQTDFGETLSWEYLTFARRYPITKWNAQTEILYAGQDNLTGRHTVDDFTDRFRSGLTVMEDGEHWFHTPEQLDVLSAWTEQHV